MVVVIVGVVVDDVNVVENEDADDESCRRESVIVDLSSIIIDDVDLYCLLLTQMFRFF